jgi:hypothetical protein
LEWSPKVGHLNRTLRDSGCLGAVLVGAEVAEPLLNVGGVPPSQVVSQPRMKLVESPGLDYVNLSWPRADGVDSNHRRNETRACACRTTAHQNASTRAVPLPCNWDSPARRTSTLSRCVGHPNGVRRRSRWVVQALAADPDLSAKAWIFGFRFSIAAASPPAAFCWAARITWSISARTPVV